MSWPRYHTDIWRPGILHVAIEDIVAGADLACVPVTWLPAQPDFSFLADPFGLWRDGKLHIFVEAYDYRDKHGVIRCLTYDGALNMLEEQTVLTAAHHLSYPLPVIEGDEVYLLPEAHASGRLTLYRARRFPHVWEPVAVVLDGPVVDASVVRHLGRWWMFYSLDGPDLRAMRELHVAVADRLEGPWLPHALNPVRNDIRAGRPGGQPVLVNNEVYLPVQDCAATYGAAVHLLRLDTLTDRTWRAEGVRTVRPQDIPGGWDGLHTLSACGPVTLIDVKRIDRSPRRAFINLQRRWRRLTRRRATPDG